MPCRKMGKNRSFPCIVGRCSSLVFTKHNRNAEPPRAVCNSNFCFSFLFVLRWTELGFSCGSPCSHISPVTLWQLTACTAILRMAFKGPANLSNRLARYAAVVCRDWCRIEMLRSGIHDDSFICQGRPLAGFCYWRLLLISHCTTYTYTFKEASPRFGSGRGKIRGFNQPLRLFAIKEGLPSYVTW